MNMFVDDAKVTEVGNDSSNELQKDFNKIYR